MLRYSWILIGLLFFTACKKHAKDTTTTVPVNRNAQLRVTVRHSFIDFSAPNHKNDTALYHAHVIIYPTADDRANNTNAEHDNYTDTAGVVLFSTLKEKYYYVTVTYPGLTTYYDEVSTPDKAIAWDDITF